VSELANQPGMDMKTLLDLSRHSSPTLSLVRYGHGRDDSRRAAVDSVPDPKAEEK
jgi:hypothetical protein